MTAANGRTCRRFTDTETQELMRLLEEGWSFRAVGRALNRSTGSINERIKWLRRTPEEHEAVNSRRNAVRSPRGIVVSAELGKGIKPDERVLRDRDRRLALPPRNLTAAICGDPLPGSSALDRMLAQVSA